MPRLRIAALEKGLASDAREGADHRGDARSKTDGGTGDDGRA